MRRPKLEQPDNPLLTPALREKVMLRVEECYSIAERHFKKSFKIPEVRFDIKNHWGGLANSKLNLIRLNLILLIENEESFIEKVVAHEAAHLINHAVSPIPKGKKRLMPHGKEWKSIMRDVFNLSPHVRHSYDCSSIEIRQRRSRRRLTSQERVSRILAQISALTPAEQRLLTSCLKEAA